MLYCFCGVMLRLSRLVMLHCGEDLDKLVDPDRALRSKVMPQAPCFPPNFRRCAVFGRFWAARGGDLLVMYPPLLQPATLSPTPNLFPSGSLSGLANWLL